MHDYYDILGVSREATPEEIKKAYRKKARQLHPDYAGPESEDAFKDLSVAYETLSDPQKRQMYDMGGPDALRGGMGGMGADPFGFGDIFSMFTGGFAAQGPAQRERRGQDSLMAIEVSLEDVTFGAQPTLNVKTWVTCDTCDGHATAQGTHPVTCSQCAGNGMVTRIQRSILGDIRTQTACSACDGYGTVIASPCPDCSGQGRVRSQRDITVNIPAGVDHGTRIRLSGQGEVGPFGGPRGDLYLEIRERKHPVFTREGDDLHTWVNVPMTAVALGTDFNLETLDGERLVTIPAGTQPNHTIKLNGLGVGRLNRNSRGNLIVHINVLIPTDLDERSRELLDELARHRGDERIEPQREPSFFERVKEAFTGK